MNIVFADSDLDFLAKNSSLDIYAFVATREAYHNRLKSAQDGFGKGEFEAELSVKSKEGGYCKADLVIHIDSDYLKIDMKLSFFDKLILAYKGRPFVSGLGHVIVRVM